MGINVLVVGEVCNDNTYYCEVSRISPEAPVPVADLIWKSGADGMAGNVNSNLRAFGIKTVFVHQPLEKHINKTRYVDQKSGQHLIRVDDTHPNITPLDVTEIDNIDQYDAIVISDYNKGFVEYETVEHLRKLYKGPIFIDSKKKDLGRFKDCIVKVNESEYNHATSVPSNLIVTKGGAGALYEDVLYPAVKADMFDVCGAGDTFLTGLVFKYLKGSSMGECIEFANKCAAIAVQHRGTYTLTTHDIESL